LVLRLISVFLILLVSIEAAPAQPSFNCAKATKPDEVAICSDPHLSELDRIAASAFSIAQRQRNTRELISNVQSLLLARMSCRADKDCILTRQVEVLRLYQQAGIQVAIPDWALRSQTASIPDGNAKCLLEVNGVHYLGGPCSFKTIDNRGSFRIGDLQNLGLIAQVISTDKDQGSAAWNGPLGGKSPTQDLGKAYRSQGCWETDSAKICAWNANEPVSVEPTSPEPDLGTVVYSGSRVGMYEDITSKEGESMIEITPSNVSTINYRAAPLTVSLLLIAQAAGLASEGTSISF
jgi:hypothetical protein